VYDIVEITCPKKETLVSIKVLLTFTIDTFIDSLASLIENCSPVSQDMNHIP
jgi:hypothetical protein